VRRQREHVLHVESSRLAKSHGVVVIEKLNVEGMIQGHLSRSIADAGWSRFAEMLRYKLAWSGGTLVEVPAAYSSQTCSACGHVDAASRHGERFFCTGCGYADHADLNAAKVLKTRANRSGLPVDGIPPEGTGRTRKVKVSLRVPRRSSSQSPVF
jgi:putative transposase